MMTLLVVAEHDNHTLKSPTLHTVAAATAIGGEIHVLVAAANAKPAAEAAAKIAGVAKVLLAEDAALAHPLAEDLAALLGWSQGTFASKLKVEGDKALVTREVDGGLETVELKLPAVMTTDLRLNEPRYASLPNIMKAKKKPIDQVTPEALSVDVAPRLVTLKVEEPAKRQGGKKVASVQELVDKLKTEARVI
ncbi:MAG TPA: hypothetical protein VET85_17635 [Stellaceae bacterium]|nr:hypothetical protein [Stellaceae bacterium]